MPWVLSVKLFRRGRRKASVFPEPVGESSITFVCLLMASTACSCMAFKESIRSALSIFGIKMCSFIKTKLGKNQVPDLQGQPTGQMYINPAICHTCAGAQRF